MESGDEMVKKAFTEFAGNTARQVAIRNKNHKPTRKVEVVE